VWECMLYIGCVSVWLYVVLRVGQCVSVLCLGWDCVSVGVYVVHRTPCVSV